MATGSLLALLDDITTMLDDVATMTQVAAKKTAGVLGDDLALNAQQVSGVDASRELPVVWAVAKGSFINKLILVPAALLISYVAPWVITPLLMIGGAFLCFEGFEKIWHKFAHKHIEKAHETTIHEAKIQETIANPQGDLLSLEQDKIKGAIRTDFILSAEIIVISLGTVADHPFSTQAMVVSLIAVVMTIGVYGLVAGIVKMDDAGLWMMQRQGITVGKQLVRKVGYGILKTVPYLMRALSVLGTAAMFLVGGAIVAHGIPAVHHWIDALGGFSFFLNGLFGLLVGALCLVLVQIATQLIAKR